MSEEFNLHEKMGPINSLFIASFRLTFMNEFPDLRILFSLDIYFLRILLLKFLEKIFNLYKHGRDDVVSFAHVK